MRATGIRVTGGLIRQTPHGSYMACTPGVKRVRRCFSTFSGAEEWLRSLYVDESPLTPAQYRDAQKAFAMLPAGDTLADAVAWYLSKNAGKAGDATLDKVWTEFLAARSGAVAPATMAKYGRVYARLAKAVGDDCPVARITASDIEALVAGESPSYRNLILRHLSPLFQFAIRKQYLSSNPVASVDRARYTPPPPSILSVAEARAVMAEAVRRSPRLVAYFAIALFAGLRPSEIVRLSPASIRNGYIVLTADQTKTADARTVPVRQNLAAWLAAYPPADLASVTPSVIYRFRTHCPVNWAPDCCRHSYASYAYELTHNATEVAAEMGHRGTGVFFRHYRALAPVGSGSEFFDITPETVCHRLP